MFKADFPESGQCTAIDYESGDYEPGQDRRRDHRTKTVHRLVKIEHERKEALARCRDISDGGMKLNVATPLDLNDRVTVTLSTAELSGRVVWVNGDDCGVSFDQPLDCARPLNASSEDAEPPHRASRLNANLGPAYTIEGKPSKAIVSGIPVRRMQIANDSNFRPGLKVRVILDNGYERDGIVRWNRDNIAGVLLLQ